MDIVYYLKRFLTEQQDEAAIPGLGVFYASNQSETGQALPAGKRLFLFKEKNPRSNAFVNYVGYAENITETESFSAIDAWVQDILIAMKTKGICHIPELGVFEISGQKVVFRPAPNQQVEEYGLGDSGIPFVAPNEPEEVKPITHTNTPPMTKKKTAPKQKSKSPHYMPWLIALAIVVILAIGVFATYKTVPSFRQYSHRTYAKLSTYFRSEPKPAETIVLGDDFMNSPESAAPEAESKPLPNKETTKVATEKANVATDKAKVATEKAKIATEKANVATAKAKVTHKASKVDGPTLVPVGATTKMNYHVIGGSFSEKENADRFQKQMVRGGFPKANQFYDTGKKLHMISLQSFATQAEALAFKANIRKEKDIACWIYKK